MYLIAIFLVELHVSLLPWGQSCLRVSELVIRWQNPSRRLSCWIVVITVSKMSWWIAARLDFTSNLARLSAFNRLYNLMIYSSNYFLRLPGPSKIHAESCFGALPFYDHRNCKSRVFRHVRYVYAWRQGSEKTDMATNSEHLVSFQRLCANQYEHLPSHFTTEDVIFQGRLSILLDAVTSWTWQWWKLYRNMVSRSTRPFWNWLN